MNHDHQHRPADLKAGRLGTAIFLNILITAAQIGGGLASGSLALLSDALHNFSDVVALLISAIANQLSGKAFSPQKTFGYKRIEMLAAMINAGTLVAIGAFLIKTALIRIRNPEIIDSFWVIGLALFSVVLNSICVALFKEDAAANLNIKAIFLHLLTDVMTSAAVLSGGILMYLYQIYWIDSLFSIMIAVYLIWASLGILMGTLRIFMQFAPPHLDIYEIEREILKFDPIAGVHHLHLWQLDDTTINLEAHLDFKEDILLSATTNIIGCLEKRMRDKFGINHTVFQPEIGQDDVKTLLCRGLRMNSS